MTSLAVIVPLYNELGNIVPFYERTSAILESLPLDWRIVFAVAAAAG